MPTITDDFNRTNETPIGGPWIGVVVNSFNLTSNVILPEVVAANDSITVYNGASWGNDQLSQGKMNVVGTNGAGAGIGVHLRSSSSVQTNYRVIADHAASGNFEIARFINGAYTSLVGWTTAWTNGDTIAAKVSGPASAAKIEVYLNGALIQTFTDNSSIASGFPGVSYSFPETSAQIDDWFGTDAFGSLLVPANRPLLMTLRPMFFGAPILAQPIPIVAAAVTGPDTLSLGDLPSAEAFSALNLQDRIALGAITSAEAFTALTLKDIINLGGITTGEALSALNLLDKISLVGITSAEAFTALNLLDKISLAGIVTAEALSALSLKDLIVLAGIASAENVPALLMPDQVILGGIASAENVPAVTLGGTDTINLTGIASAEALSALLLRDNMSLGGIASAETLSALRLLDQVSLAGVATGETVPTAFQSAMVLQGILSGEVVPALTLTTPGGGGGGVTTNRQMTGYGQ